MSLLWTLSGRGWADCVVADDQTQAEATASYLTLAPDELLTAVTRMVLYQGETRVQFEAEPTAYRWIFYREGDQVWVQLLQLANGALHDKAGTQIWSSWQTVDTVARAVIRAFDDVATKYGTSRYHDTWGHPFPSTELDKLRTTWRHLNRLQIPEQAEQRHDHR